MSDTASLHIRQPHPSSQRRPSCSHTLVYLICVVVFIHEQWQLQSLLLPSLPPPNHHRVETPEIRRRCQQRHFHINPLSLHRHACTHAYSGRCSQRWTSSGSSLLLSLPPSRPHTPCCGARGHTQTHTHTHTHAICCVKADAGQKASTRTASRST